MSTRSLHTGRSLRGAKLYLAKMKSTRDVQLLREYLREVLCEDGEFGDIGMDNGPGGAHFASGDQMYKIFVKPFTDVVKVAAGKTKEMSTRTQTVLNVAFQSVATTLVPVLQDTYDEVFADEHKSLEKIKSEYAAVYGETWEAFQKSDFLLAAFMYRPDLFLTGAFIKKSPKVALKLASILSGGKLDSIISSLTSKGRSNEGLVREASGIDKLESFFGNDKVKKILSSSNLSRKMAEDGQEVVRGTLKKVFSQASEVLSATSLQSIQKVAGKQIPGLQKLSELEGNERQSAEQNIMKAAKAGMKAFYVKQLESRVKKAVDAGVPKDHPFVKDHLNVISKIKAL